LKGGKQLESSSIPCEYLIENLKCEAIEKETEGEEIRKNSCINEDKYHCCYLCSSQTSCKISCIYMEDPSKRAEVEALKETRRLETIYKQNRLEAAQDYIVAGRYEEAARVFDELGNLARAGECRRMAKTTYVVSANVNIAKVGSISMECPHCSASQPIASKSNEVTCSYCKKNYVIPKKVLELL
jgi:hypothetical protein